MPVRPTPYSGRARLAPAANKTDRHTTVQTRGGGEVVRRMTQPGNATQLVMAGEILRWALGGLEDENRIGSNQDHLPRLDREGLEKEAMI